MSQDPPQVYEYVNAYVKNINENVTLTCEYLAECGLPDDYTWQYIAGKKIPGSNNSQVLNFFPNLTSVMDSLQVKCEVGGNDFGSNLRSRTIFTIRVRDTSM